MVKYDNQGLAKEAFHYSSLGVKSIVELDLKSESREWVSEHLRVATKCFKLKPQRKNRNRRVRGDR